MPDPCRFGWSGRALPLLVACAFALLLCGCQQGMYSAAKLPTAYAAPPPRAAKNLDLSRLARHTLGNNIIYPGDVIHVLVATPLGAEGQQIDNKPLALRVTEDGYVHDPEIGPIQVAGMELTAAEATIRDEAIKRGKYVDPIVTVTLGERKANRVTVMGAVTKPGEYQLPAAGSDLLAALSAAEGLSDQAGSVIEIRHPDTRPGWAANSRGGSRVVQAGYRGEEQDLDQNPPLQDDPGNADPGRRFVHVDLLEATAGADSPDLHLEDGSAVVVMRKPAEYVQVMGLVHQGAQYEMPVGTDLRVLNAIGMAGGVSMSLANKIHISRKSPVDGKTILIETSISEAKRNDAANLRLMPGDVVSVEETPLTFTVTTVQGLIRFAAIPLTP